jgi:hypothetical protein
MVSRSVDVQPFLSEVCSEVVESYRGDGTKRYNSQSSKNSSRYVCSWGISFAQNLLSKGFIYTSSSQHLKEATNLPERLEYG